MAPRGGLDRTSQSAPVNDDLPESLTDPVTIDLMINPSGTDDGGRKLKKINGSPGRPRSDLPVGPSHLTTQYVTRGRSPEMT
jgi:hypothetical protein